MAWTQGRPYNDCLVCFKEISECESKIPIININNKFSLSTPVEKSLLDLSTIMKISPTIFDGIDTSSLPCPVYCSACRGIVLNCLEILRQMQCLESTMNSLTSTLKNEFIESYYNSVSPPSTTTKEPPVLSRDGGQLQSKAVSSSTSTKPAATETELTKNQIRKTFAQCWSHCSVNIGSLVTPNQNQVPQKPTRLTKTRCKKTKTNQIVTGAQPEAGTVTVTNELQIKLENHTGTIIDNDDIDDIQNDLGNDNSPSFFVSAFYETNSESDMDLDEPHVTEPTPSPDPVPFPAVPMPIPVPVPVPAPVPVPDLNGDPLFVSATSTGLRLRLRPRLPLDPSPRVLRKKTTTPVEIIIEDDSVTDSDATVSDSGSVYIPNSPPPAPAMSVSVSRSRSRSKRPTRAKKVKTIKTDITDSTGTETEPIKPRKKINYPLHRKSPRANPNSAKKSKAEGPKAGDPAYQRWYRQQKKLNKNLQLKYNCELCGTSYNFARSLLIHQNRHLESAFYTCIHCNLLFYNENKLCTHEVETHKEELNTDLELELEELVAQSHLELVEMEQDKKHVEGLASSSSYKIKGGILESYKCRYCKTEYVRDDFISTAPTANDNDANFLTIKCDIPGCNETFSNFRLFQLHHDNTCLSIPAPDPEVGPTSNPLPLDPATVRRQFFAKALSIRAAEALTSDVPRYANGRKKKPVPKKSKVDGLLLKAKKAMARGKDFLFECAVCGKSYNKLQHYEGHMKAHQGVVIAECDLCDEKFISEVAMRMHRSKAHVNCIRNYDTASGLLISFKCVFCKKEYVLKDLITQDDEGNSIIRCDILGCSSVHPADRFLPFSRHHQKYCLSKPQLPPKLFPCDVCGKVFSNQCNVDNHKVSIHTKVYPYYCDECGRGKVSVGQLNRHKQLVHAGLSFKCGKCDKIYRKKEMYQIHLRKHNNDFRHMCGQCGKRFLTARSLKLHDATHLGESDRNFPCHLCGKLFKAPHYVRKHVWSTHKGGSRRTLERKRRQKMGTEPEPGPGPVATTIEPPVDTDGSSSAEVSPQDMSHAWRSRAADLLNIPKPNHTPTEQGSEEKFVGFHFPTI